MNELLAAMAQQGLNPGAFSLDGKLHKFKIEPNDHKYSGWVIGWQHHTVAGGEVFVVAEFGNMREGGKDSRHSFKSDVVYSKEDNKIIREKMAKAKKAEEERKEILHEISAKECQALWETFSTVGESPYLDRKKIAGVNLGVRFDGGFIYVPIQDETGKIWSLESIAEDGEKRYYPGGRKKGGLFIIGSISDSEAVYITEGFSTGASVRIATKKAVVVAFDSGNLSNAASIIRKKYPHVPIIICGDDDKWKDPVKNPGRESAEAAAHACFGIAVYPAFTDEASSPTDFNDLHVLQGLEAVSALLDIKPPPAMAVYPLGFDGDTCFFTSTQNRQIVPISTFTEDKMLNLMTINYWEVQYPSHSGQGRVDWTSARSDLKDQARRRGIFKGRLVRGAGVWNDEGRIVVNMGNHLIVDGRRVELGELKSGFFYTLGSSLSALHTNSLSVSECSVLVDACKTLKWKKPDSGLLLAGALVLSRICGALPVRPHTWITGAALTGKTTLLERIIKPILGENKVYVVGNTSEAGIRQTLGSDAIPILFDEFETNGPDSAAKIALTIDLMRASWSETGGVIIKGGANGHASQYQVRFSAIVSSIRTNLLNEADRGRFAVLELEPHGGDADQWLRLVEYTNQIDAEFCNRLFSRTIKNIPNLLSNFKLLKVALARTADTRFGDQYGMLLAGFSILIMDDPITAEEATWLVSQINLDEQREVSKQSDQLDALSHLLTTSVAYQGMNERKEALIGELIGIVHKSSLKDSYERDVLKRLGIIVREDSVAVASGNHAEQQRVIWKNEKWSKIWGDSLSRLQGATKGKLVKIAGTPFRCIIVPISHFIDQE
jgi:putative DNA primase/helicase